MRTRATSVARRQKADKSGRRIAYLTVATCAWRASHHWLCLADAAEAELGDDAGGARVVDEVAAGEAAEAAGREAVVDHGAGRLGGEPAAPPRLADPVADLGQPPSLSM